MYYEEEESIYNLIPKESVAVKKDSMYRSKHSNQTRPTGSTFCLGTTSVPGIGNLNGATGADREAHTNKARTGTFGGVKGGAKKDPNTFTKRGTGTMKLDQPKKFARTNEFKKVSVPKRDEKPIMNLVTTKNFVTANAVENILAAPKTKDNKGADPLQKKEYGQVPRYLQKIKGEIDEEYELVRDIQRQEDEEMNRQRFLLSDDERQALLEGLKKKWEVVHKEYQGITHLSNLDTLGLKRKKEGYEKSLAQIEKDIEKLSKQYIFVDATQM